MGIVLALAGLAFTWVLYTAWQRAEETRRWVATPCQIVSARLVSERPSPNANLTHKAVLRYRYSYQGNEYEGHRIKRVDAATVHEDVARRNLQAYPLGLKTTCYVNPHEPGQSVLRHDSRAALYSIWFPLLFVAGGIGIAWNALRRC